jgi:hypothetical protein
MGTITKLSSLSSKQKRNLISDIFMLIVCVAGLLISDSLLTIIAYATGIIALVTGLRSVFGNLPEETVKRVFEVDMIVTFVCFSLYVFFIGIYWLSAMFAVFGILSIYKTLN